MWRVRLPRCASTTEGDTKVIAYYGLWVLTMIGAAWAGCFALWLVLLLVSWVSYKRTVRRIIKHARLNARPPAPSENR